jgi:hypothetical protein
MIQKFNAPCNFSGTIAPFIFWISDEYMKGKDPLFFQKDWLQKVRGGTLDPKISEGIIEIAKIAEKNKLSFEYLFGIAMNAALEKYNGTKDTSDLEKFENSEKSNKDDEDKFEDEDEEGDDEDFEDEDEEGDDEDFEDEDEEDYDEEDDFVEDEDEDEDGESDDDENENESDSIQINFKK